MMRKIISVISFEEICLKRGIKKFLDDGSVQYVDEVYAFVISNQTICFKIYAFYCIEILRKN